MSEEDNDFVLAFDHFYTTNHIQILKSILPFIDNQKPSMLPVIIKYMELQYTISLLKTGSDTVRPNIAACSSNESPDINKIYQAVHKYLTPEEDKGFQQLVSISSTLAQVKEMQQMMEIFKEAAPDSMNPLDMMNQSDFNMSDMMNNSDFNIIELMNLLKNMNE